MISEKIELLGKGMYTDIPNELTLSSIPTASELDYVSAEDFTQTMLDKILPSAIEEKINFSNLLEIDFQWICRCLRLINYGPYYTTNSIFCRKCGQVKGEARVNLRTIGVKTFPEGFVNDIVISRDEFIDFKGDIHLHMPTIKEMMNAYKDKMFNNPLGKANREYARMCYMITSMGKETNMTPVAVKLAIEKNISSADYVILKEKVTELTDYGLRAGGTCTCPRCKSEDAAYLALVDDKFFRPTVGDIKAGGDDRSARGDEDARRAEN